MSSRPPNLESVYELSPMQQGILFHVLYESGSGVYLEQSLVELVRPIDEGVFRDAWQRLTDRHAVLRTSFHWEDLDKPVQVVHRRVAAPVEAIEGSEVADSDASIRELLVSDRARGFDLGRAPLFRITLLAGRGRNRFLLSFHHLILDRWSRLLLLRELATVYDALADGREPSLPPASPYADYIRWIQRQDRSGAEAFWRARLAGISKPTALEVASEDPVREGYGEERLAISRQISEELREFARRSRLTLSTLVCGAWALLSSRYTREDDVLFGATVSGRPGDLPGVESIVGLFINTLPVRARVDPREPVRAWLARLQEELSSLREHEASSLSDVQGWSEVPRGTPLFETILVFENVGGGPTASEAAGGGEGFRVAGIRSEGSRTDYPLTVLVLPGEEISLRIVYDRGRFGATAVSRMLGHFATLLEAIPRSPETPLGELPMLLAEERRRILVEFNRTDRDFLRERTLHELFEAQAARTPDSPAVYFGNQMVTYRELSARANRLARRLSKLGVGPETLVGVCLDRSLEMLISLLATLKAGGAYVPLDPGYPAERLAFMVQDSEAAVVITQESFRPRLGSRRLLVLDDESERLSIASEDAEDPPRLSSPDNLAYVLYTSGSTGRPKGVALEHRSAVAFVEWALSVFGPQDLAGVLASTSISFDLSVFEIFTPLACGGSIVLGADALSLPELPERERVTLINTVPSAMEELVRSGGLPPAVRVVNLAGEPLRSELVARIYDGRLIESVYNLYGPTEATTYSTFVRIPRGATGPMTIGRPIANTRVYVLDPARQPVPVGVAGELYIGGAGLARGYLKQPELTAQRFVPDPFSEATDSRLYRTGDLARYREDGQIEFLGRLDHQVKVRGFRVELGEIETSLLGHPGVLEAVAVAREDAPGDQRLVAYVVSDPAATSDPETLRNRLRSRLPAFMVPSDFVVLGSMPRTPNGKIDRARLPPPDGTRPEREASYEAPRNPIEQALAALWEELLGVPRVGIRDGFFELGGHSLLATRLVSRARSRFAVELPLRALFEHPTVADFARVIQDATSRGPGPVPAGPVRLPRDTRRKPPAVSPEVPVKVSGD